MPAIDVKQAVNLATTYLADLYDMTKFEDVLLEGVEISDDEKYWEITLRMMRPVPPEYTTSPITAAMEQLAGAAGTKRKQLEKVYRTFKIDAQTGAFRAMNETTV